MSKFAASIICIIGLLCSTGCALQANQPPVIGIEPATDSASLQRRQFMVGTWLEESALADGTSRRELVDRNVDGHYRMQFRTYNKDGTHEDQIEVGEWGISGNIYFTITKGWMIDGVLMSSDLTEPDYYDAYTIIKLTADEFTYKSVVIPDVYTARRVDPAYQLPNTAPSVK